MRLSARKGPRRPSARTFLSAACRSPTVPASFCTCATATHARVTRSRARLSLWMEFSRLLERGLHLRLLRLAELGAKLLGRVDERLRGSCGWTTRRRAAGSRGKRPGGKRRGRGFGGRETRLAAEKKLDAVARAHHQLRAEQFQGSARWHAHGAIARAPLSSRRPAPRVSARGWSACERGVQPRDATLIRAERVGAERSIVARRARELGDPRRLASAPFESPQCPPAARASAPASEKRERRGPRAPRATHRAHCCGRTR